MGAEVSITEGSDLSRINRVIHDYWFDLDDVTFNEASSTVESGGRLVVVIGQPVP